MGRDFPSRFVRYALAGAVALSAPAARANVVISSAPTENMVCANGICAPTYHRAVLNVTDLTNMLASSNVTVTNVVHKGKREKSAQNIDIIVPLGWTSANKLTLLDASYDFTVSIDAPVTVMGQGGLAIAAGRFLIAPGATVTFWDLNSVLSIGTYVESHTYTLIGDLPTLVSDIVSHPAGFYAFANDYDAKQDRFRKAPIPIIQGEFTGLGHSIANLRIAHGYKGCEGLFSTNKGGLHDMRLTAVTVSSDSKSRSVGAVTGCNYGMISNVSVDGSVSGVNNANVGGVAGAILQDGSVSNAHTAVSVTGGQAGGIVGENDNSVYQASASGLVTGNVNSKRTGWL